MDHKFDVLLDTSVTPHVLYLQDHGRIHIDKRPDPQKITWQLKEELSAGSFVEMSDPQPGFQWESDPAPPSDVFGRAILGPSRKSLSIEDTHKNTTSDGRWIYKLRVLYKNTVYCTTSTVSVGDTINDPIIINR